MKIYMPDFVINNIKNKLSDLEPYYNKSDKHHLLYSDSGIYSIKDNSVIQLVPNDADIVSHLFNDKIKLILDNSEFISHKVHSYIPAQHTLLNKTFFHYTIGSSTILSLIIEGTYDNISLNSDINYKDLNNKYYNFIPDDIYFYTNENIENILLKKELNVFISVLY